MNNSGFTANNYFNSGVLYMNIEEMKKVNFSKSVLNAISKIELSSLIRTC